MKLVVAQMMHETNTFSPVPTPLKRFAFAGGEAPPEGEAALAAMAGADSGLTGFLDIVQPTGAQIVVPVAGHAWPSGPVEDAAYEHMAGRIVAAVRAGCDGVLLDLHGAMVTQSLEDGEGELLRRIRSVAPGVPIGVALDMHTNLYDAMGEHSSVMAGYQTYPHIDTRATGQRAARALLAQLQGRATPTMAWGRAPMLPHVMRKGTADSPNREIQARCQQMEAEGALCASVFVGFPNADIHDAGLSAVVVTNNDTALARRWRDELLAMAWAARSQFVYRPEPLAQSMAQALALAADKPAGAGPVVLLDHCDNCASGGSMDTMTVLGAMLDAGMQDAAAFAIFDPHAVQALIATGVGQEATLALGGKLDMPGIGLTGQPRTLTGTVRRITDGRYRNVGPMGTGGLMDMGPTVVWQVGGVQVVVISKHVEPHDVAALESVGIAPQRLRCLMLKSRIHWRAGLRPLAHAVVECNGTGVCTSDYSALPFKRLRRPIYPLDSTLSFS